MKLQTSIPARKDGTVIVAGQNGVSYTFKPNDAGELTCDVADEGTVSALLAGGNFYPEDPADYDRAAALAHTGGDGDDDPDKDPDSDDDEPNMNALPVEAQTPPASAPRAPRAPRAAKSATNKAK